MSGTLITDPAPSAVPRGCRMLWYGWDGSVWDLTDYQSGTFLAAGTRGLGFGSGLITHYRQTSPQIYGSTWQGFNVENRSVFWNLHVARTNRLPFLDLDRALWNTFLPDKTGTWVIILPDGTTRSVNLRLESDGDWTMDLDPTIYGWATYPVTFTAEAPLWRGDTISRSWTTPDTVLGFHDGPGVINITQGSNIGSAVLNNPGQVPAYVTWTATGPCTSFTVGTAGKQIVVASTLTTGQTRTLYTSPDTQFVVDAAGVDRTSEITGSPQFVPIQPGAQVPLALAQAGVGPGSSVQADLVPLYYRAVS